MVRSVSTLIFIVIVALMLRSHDARAQQPGAFTFTTIDVPFANARGTQAFSINTGGDIVGRYFEVTLGGQRPRGFLRMANGTFNRVDVPVANNGTVPRGNNDSGDIVGNHFDAAGTRHGFLLTRTGTFTPFDVPSADAGTTTARSVNNRGQIVGDYEAPTSIPPCGTASLPHGFLMDAATRSFTLIDVPGALMTLPTGIDDASDVVGTYISAPAGLGSCNPATVVLAHGFVRFPSGAYSTIDAPASTGAVNTTIDRLNNNGEVIGGYVSRTLTALQVITGDVGTVGGAFVLSASAFTPIDFTSLPTARGGQLFGLNSRGSIVGSYNDGQRDHGLLGTR